LERRLGVLGWWFLRDLPRPGRRCFLILPHGVLASRFLRGLFSFVFRGGFEEFAGDVAALVAFFGLGVHVSLPLFRISKSSKEKT
jgi:hypothetical protein